MFLLGKRDLGDVIDIDHSSNQTYKYDEDPSNLFTSNSTCLLMPDVTEGPYCELATKSERITANLLDIGGEFVRQNVVDGQKGVPLYLDVQLYDTSSCDPLKDVHFEIWHSVYSDFCSDEQC
jgi:protocatechuate 3,4-dioxygenase beta subunit